MTLATAAGGIRRRPVRDPAPDAVPDGFSGARGTAVHDLSQQHVRVALIEALAMAYPAVARLVGTPFFERMANLYAAGHPALARTLNLYGGEFADFIAGFAPARELPYLADVAQGWNARCSNRFTPPMRRRSTRRR